MFFSVLTANPHLLPNMQLAIQTPASVSRPRELDVFWLCCIHLSPDCLSYKKSQRRFLLSQSIYSCADALYTHIQFADTYTNARFELSFHCLTAKKGAQNLCLSLHPTNTYCCALLNICCKNYSYS